MFIMNFVQIDSYSSAILNSASEVLGTHSVWNNTGKGESTVARRQNSRCDGFTAEYTLSLLYRYLV